MQVFWETVIGKWELLEGPEGAFRWTSTQHKVQLSVAEMVCAQLQKLCLVLLSVYMGRERYVEKIHPVIAWKSAGVSEHEALQVMRVGLLIYVQTIFDLNKYLAIPEMRGQSIVD